MHRSCVLVASLWLSACGTGEVSQTVFPIESLCTFAPRLAVVVEILAPDGVTIDSVTATNEREQHCYLERPLPQRDADAGEVGEPSTALFSCLAQGHGAYEVRVKSGKRVWAQSVDVEAYECHSDKLQKLTFELD